MSRRGRILQWSLAISAILCCGAGFTWWHFHTERGPLAEGVTADGAVRIRLLAVGAGKVDYQPDPRMRGMLEYFMVKWGLAKYTRWLPASRNLHPMEFQNRAGAPGIILLFEKVDAKTGLATQFRLADRAQVRFVESSGFMSRGRPEQLVQFATGQEAISLGTFPRRDRELLIVLDDTRNDGEILRCRVPNPGYLPNAPEWKPVAVPHKESGGPISITMDVPDWNTTSQTCRPVFHVDVVDPAWTKHSVRYWFEDATGNFGDALSPFESAWKARVAVNRNEAAEFGTGEKWTSALIAMPEAETVVLFEETGLIGASRIGSVAVSGETTRRLSRTGKSWQLQASRAVRSAPLPSDQVLTGKSAVEKKPSAWIGMHLDDVPANTDLIVEVRDQTGKLLRSRNLPIPTSQQSMNWAVDFVAEPDTRQVSVTVILSPACLIDVFVAPPPELREKWQGQSHEVRK